MPRLLIVLLVACLGAGAWLLLPFLSGDGPGGVDEPAPLRPSSRPPAEHPEDAPLGPPDLVVVDPRHPLEVVGEEDRRDPSGDMSWEQVITVTGLDRGRIRGEDLLEILRSQGPVRFRGKDDLEALRGATLSVRARESAEISLRELIEVCREAGLGIDPVGRAWDVHGFVTPDGP